MLIEIIISLLFGIIFGVFTGLVPGIHINLIGIFVASSSFLSFKINPIYSVIFISSMAITHTFVDFIPSILLGCPDTDTELSVLPGHELLKEGEGYEAILLTLYGSFSAVILLIIISYPSIILISNIYNFLEKIIPYLLIFILIILVYLEKKRFTAFMVLLFTGLLGWSVLNMGLKEPLLPLLTGLFGGSMLIKSIKEKTQIPEQKIEFPKLKKEILIKPLLGSLISSPLCSFLPGLGSGQAAVIGNTISKTDRKGFLILLGATNTLVMGFSFISLYIISKTRTGAAVAIKNIIGTLSLELLIIILFTILITGTISFFITKKIAAFSIKKINKINYQKISIITFFVLVLIISLFSGLMGLLVFFISVFTGIYCISLDIKRTNMMGCLLIPVILLYLF